MPWLARLLRVYLTRTFSRAVCSEGVSGMLYHRCLFSIVFIVYLSSNAWQRIIYLISSSSPLRTFIN